VTDRVVGYRSNDFDAGEDGGFADTPVDFSTTNASFDIHQFVMLMGLRSNCDGS